MVDCCKVTHLSLVFETCGCVIIWLDMRLANVGQTTLILVHYCGDGKVAAIGQP